MPRSFEVRTEGLGNVLKALKDVGYEFKGREVGYMLQAAGRKAAQQMKREIPFSGEIKKKLIRDIGVSKPKGTDKPFVIVGAMFLDQNKIGNEKVAVIAQHMTEGFLQTTRSGYSNRSRGKVRNQLSNPIINGWKNSEGPRLVAINLDVQKKLLKIKAKNRGVVR